MDKPQPNRGLQARATQLTADSLVTSLSLSTMAIGPSYGAIALGLAFVVLRLVIAGPGYALLGLITPEVAERFGLQLVAVTGPASASGRSHA